MNDGLIRYADLVADEATLYGRAGRDAGGADSFHLVDTAAAAIHAIRHAVGRARIPYTHDAAEVLFVHTGRWRVSFGAGEDEGSVLMGPCDAVCVPAHVFHGIDKLDEDPGFLLICRDRKEGAEQLAPDLWIDVSSGEHVLREWDSGTPEDVPRAEVADGSLRRVDTVPAAADILPHVTAEGFEATSPPDHGPPGFTLRLLTLPSGAYIPSYARVEPEVFFLQTGSLEVRWAGGAVMMGAGDTLSVPVGRSRSLRNTTSGRAQALVLRGTV